MVNLYKKLVQGKNFNRNLYLLALLLVFLMVVVINFPFNSWYTGWDNLHPEFDFWLNFKRAFQAVWQENQGTGTYGGHGYAATLPHTLILFLMSFLIPIKYLRSSFTFLTLVIGSVGVFFLIRKALEGKNEDLRNKAAFMGGLFYMLNFGTVENFYIQLEAFIIHFAALPWLFYTLINFLQHQSKKNFVIFFVVSFFASAQGFIPPLFFVYLILLGIFLLSYVSKERSLSSIKTALTALIITLAINAYWFLPVVNYTFTRSSTYLNSYNNISSTEDFIYKNQKYGGIKDIIILRGFIIEALDITESGNTISIFNEWNNHLNNYAIYGLGVVSFGLILIGALMLLNYKDDYVKMAILLGFIVSFSLLATNIFPFSLATEILKLIPVARQAFRVAFTKFSISLALFYALCFGMGTYVVFNYIKRKTNLILAFLIAALIMFSYPIFKGNFLYQRTKITIPQVYFDLFDYFGKKDKDTRIANFPQGWNWGWSIYRWGYTGSGFLWYGIEQPIMDRAFDVWGKYNEDYYWEVTHAVYSENFPLLENILDKYRISWIVLDKNILPYQNVKGNLYTDKLEQYLKDSKKFTLTKVLQSKDKSVKTINIYQRKGGNYSTKSPVFLYNLKNVGPQDDFINFDYQYIDQNDYYTDINNDLDVYYPFRNISSYRNKIDLVDKDDHYVLKALIPESWKNYTLDNETLNNPNIAVIDNEISIKISKRNLLYSYNSKGDLYFSNHQAVNCGFDKQSGHFDQKTNNNLLRFTSVNSENCYSIRLDNFPQKYAYLVKVESENIKEKGLQFALINNDTRKSEFETSLSDKRMKKYFFVVPPMKKFGMGYTLTFNNISIGNNESINDVKSIQVYQFPYEVVSSIKLVNTKSDNNKTVALFQAYDPGWKAYSINKVNPLNTYFPFFFGSELKEHVLVNNWANGWVLTGTNIQKSNIIVVFWPQYLEFIGFGILFIVLSVLFLKKSR
jgi:hypothetical protein